MKFALAILAYGLIGLVLSAGILLLLAGKPWLLIISLVTYVVAFGKIGCMTHRFEFSTRCENMINSGILNPQILSLLAHAAHRTRSSSPTAAFHSGRRLKRWTFRSWTICRRFCKRSPRFGKISTRRRHSWRASFRKIILPSRAKNFPPLCMACRPNSSRTLNSRSACRAQLV